MANPPYGPPGWWDTGSSSNDPWNPTNPGWGNAATVVKKKRPGVGGTRVPGTAPWDPAVDAQANADRIIQAMLDSVKAQQDAERQAAERDAQDALARGQALAYGLQQMGLGKTVQEIFQQAAGNQSSLASGFSGEIRDQAQAQADAQAKALTGTGQEGAVRNEGANMGNVTYGLGGWIPGTELNTLGAAFGANAALQPGFAEQFGALEQASRLRDWANQAPERAAQLSDVLAKKPELYLQLLGQNRDYAAQQASARSAAQEQAYARYKDQRDFSYQKYVDQLNAQIAAGKLNLSQAQLQLKQWEAAHPEPSNLQFKNVGGQLVGIDPISGQVATVVGPAGSPKQPKGAKASDKINGLTPGQYANSQQKAQSKIEGWFGGVENAAGEVVSAPLTYQQVINRLTRQYKLKLVDAQDMANQYWTERGKSGRPALSYQERQKLKKSGVSAATIKRVQVLFNRASGEKNPDVQARMYAEAQALLDSLLQRLG